MHIEKLSSNSQLLWNTYVSQRPEATVFHRAGWKKVIESSMGYEGTYLMAVKDEQIVGVYPLFILSTGLFGTMGVSLPYLNYGGILADSHEIEKCLIDKVEIVGREAGCRYIELRQRFPLHGNLSTSGHKVTSVIPLHGGPDAVFGRLHQNVRNKIRKAKKNGILVQRGGEYLSDFYRVYSHNLRDLGTPVLTRRFFEHVANVFPLQVRVYRATRHGRTIGAKVVLVDKKTCYFVWSATVRESLCYSPVHALNWTAIEDACANGCLQVDFGRSTVDSTHYNFKKYWGGDTQILPWAYQLFDSQEIPVLNKENPRFSMAISLWKKLPIFLTRWLGPPLARRLP